MATPQGLLSSLARAYSLTETRYAGDPEYVKAIQEVQKAHADFGWLVVRVGREGFSVGGEAFQEPSNEWEGFKEALEHAGVKEFRLQGTVSEVTLEDFFRRLLPSQYAKGTLPSSRFRGLGVDLGLSFREPQTAVPGMAGGIQSLFPTSTAAEERPPSQDFRPDPAEKGLIPEDRGAAPPEKGTISQDLLGTARAYLETRGEARKEMENRIRAGVRELKHDRDLPGLAALVELLLGGGDVGEGREGGNEKIPHDDEEAVDFARGFITPAVASHIVARLGSVREETERADLVRVISQAGREGALALTDALGESKDRFQRRSYMDAMVALGPEGLEMAKGMVDDPRWFVVRNGVSLLGELGGKDAVAHLTATLANEDSRVRRETVLSLAKVGGRDAETLVLGMLEDPDSEVRAKACRALGILKPNRGVKPLMGLLKDDSLEVQVECLEALGQIGDPGALQPIEKRALGGMLSRRPPREVRIAAFRALAGIGTVGALSALRKGAKDPDDGVRTVVKALYTTR